MSDGKLCTKHRNCVYYDQHEGHCSKSQGGPPIKVCLSCGVDIVDDSRDPFCSRGCKEYLVQRMPPDWVEAVRILGMMAVQQPVLCEVCDVHSVQYRIRAITGVAVMGSPSWVCVGCVGIWIETRYMAEDQSMFEVESISQIKR